MFGLGLANKIAISQLFWFTLNQSNTAGLILRVAPARLRQASQRTERRVLRYKSFTAWLPAFQPYANIELCLPDPLFNTPYFKELFWLDVTSGGTINVTKKPPEARGLR